MGRKFVAAAVLIVLVGGVFLLFSSHRTASSDENIPNSASIALRAERGSGTSATPSHESYRAPPALPLPSADSAVNTYFSELEHRARGGDVRAACRLSYDIIKCGSRTSDISFASNLKRKALATADPLSKERLLKDAASLDSAAMRLEDICRGWNVPDERDAFDYQLAAAKGGVRGAMVRFVGAPAGISVGRALADLDRWNLYRTEAPLILQRAIQAGAPEAVLFAANASLNRQFNAVDLVPHDPANAIMYFAALIPVAKPSYRESLQVSISELRSQVSDSQFEAAMREGSKLSRSLKFVPAGGVDFSRTIFGAETNGPQYCQE